MEQYQGCSRADRWRKPVSCLVVLDHLHGSSFLRIQIYNRQITDLDDEYDPMKFLWANILGVDSIRTRSKFRINTSSKIKIQKEQPDINMLKERSRYHDQ